MAVRYKADYRSIAFVALYFAFVGLAWVAPFKWYFVLGFSALISVWSFFCSVIIHNTIHAPVFDNKRQNRLFQFFLTLSHGHPVSGFVPGHNLSHHKHLLTDKDAARTYRMRYKWNFLNQFLFFFHMVRDVSSMERKFFFRMWKERPNWAKQYLMEAGLLLGIKLALTFADPIKAVFFLWIPHFYAVWAIFGTNFWQHDGCDEHHKYNHSRNFVSPILNYWIFNNGFHCAHHLKANLHWSLLPSYHAEYIEPYNHPNLNQASLFTYLWKTCVWPGHRLDYKGDPIVLQEMDESGDWVDAIRQIEDPMEMGAIVDSAKEKTKSEEMQMA